MKDKQKSKKHNRKRAETILFAVTGMSPAVLTETIWALANEKPANLLDRVVVLTTAKGARQMKKELFEPVKDFGGKSTWDCLRSALSKLGHDVERSLRFGDTASDIRVFTVSDRKSNRSVELEDIRTPEENAAVADFILEQLRSFTENSQVRVIASIAGGRKTMGALLYACMTLVGRETDRLTHVLVNEPFESPGLMPRFYFPGQPSHDFETQTGAGRISISEAKVELADIPFVPLRNRFRELAETPGNFSGLVYRYSSELREGRSKVATVVVDEQRGCVAVDGVEVKLRNRSIQVLRYLLHANKQKELPRGQPEAVEPMKAFIGPANSTWILNADDIKRELSEIRKRFAMANICWIPGERRHSLVLPSFVLKNSA